MLKQSFNRIDLLNKALDGAWLKNSAIANNIANVNTPGYKRQTVNFEDVLRSELGKNKSTQMSTTNSKHMSHPGTNSISVQTVQDTKYRVDGSNVDVDVENAEMAKNTLYYNAVVNSLNGQFARLKATFNINK